MLRKYSLSEKYGTLPRGGLCSGLDDQWHDDMAFFEVFAGQQALYERQKRPK